MSAAGHPGAPSALIAVGTVPGSVLGSGIVGSDHLFADGVGMHRFCVGPVGPRSVLTAKTPRSDRCGPASHRRQPTAGQPRALTLVAGPYRLSPLLCLDVRQWAEPDRGEQGLLGPVADRTVAEERGFARKRAGHLPILANVRSLCEIVGGHDVVVVRPTLLDRRTWSPDRITTCSRPSTWRGTACTVHTRPRSAMRSPRRSWRKASRVRGCHGATVRPRGVNATRRAGRSDRARTAGQGLTS